MGQLLWVVFIGTAVLAGLQAIWQAIVAVAVIGFVLWVIHGLVESRRINANYQQDCRQATVRRADLQHSQILAGKQKKGTYGNYLPPKGLR